MRRATAAIVAALLLLTGACGDDDDDSGDAVAPGTDTSTTAVGGDPGTTSDAGGDGDGDGPPVTDAAPDGGGDAPAPADPDTDGGPGSAAPFFLRPEPATAIVLEVSAEPGAEPSDDTVQHVANTLIAVTGKGVSVSAGGALPSDDVWSPDEVRAAADAAARTSQGGGRAVIRLLFVHGEYSESDTVLGVAVRGDVAAVFSDRVDAAETPLIGSGAIETAVTTHEIGHLLGLVDSYLDTGRDDPEHPGHSTNRSSVMYWAVESSLVSDLLTGGPPRDFDDADRADLAAIRNGA